MYRKNEDFFKNMNHDVAYVLGFTITDGCVYIHNKQRFAVNGTKNGHTGLYRVSWISTDYSVLHFIQQALETDQPIHKRPRSYYDKYGYKNVKKQWILQINSKEIVFDLLAYGVTPRKSKTVVFDIGIPEDFMPDYIRGIFDGDGSIGVYNGGNGYESMKSTFTSGSRRFLEDLGSFLKDQLYIIPKIRQTVGGAYQLHYGVKETVALCHYMYKDIKSFTLERKKRIYDEFMQKHPKFAIRRCQLCGNEFVATTGLQRLCKQCKKKIKQENG